MADEISVEAGKRTYLNGTDISDICIEASESREDDPNSGHAVIFMMGGATKTMHGLAYHYIHDGVQGFNPLTIKLTGYVRIYNLPAEIKKFEEDIQEKRLRIRTYEHG
jgi:hypothetical protein